MTFDRPLYIDRLKQAGVAQPVARAHAEALRDALSETVATNVDLKEAEVATRAVLKEVEAALDRRSEMLDRKIEITARDLTIRRAAGLVATATLIVGLKLFG